MKYLKIVNIPLADLFERNGKIVWEDFGLDPSVMRRLLLQRQVGNDYIQLLPLSDEAKYLTKKAELEAIVEATPIETDSIEIITETVAETLKIEMLAEEIEIVE